MRYPRNRTTGPLLKPEFSPALWVLGVYAWTLFLLAFLVPKTTMHDGLYGIFIVAVTTLIPSIDRIASYSLEPEVTRAALAFSWGLLAPAVILSTLLTPGIVRLPDKPRSRAFVYCGILLVPPVMLISLNNLPDPRTSIGSVGSVMTFMHSNRLGLGLTLTALFSCTAFTFMAMGNLFKAFYRDMTKQKP